MGTLLTAYEPAKHEALLLAWFFELRGSGDIEKVMYPDLHTITVFLNHYANSVKLGFATDAKGIYFAAWVRPLMDAGEFGMWIRKDKRHSPSSLKCLYEAYDSCFTRFNVLLGVSKQAQLRELHEKLGYVFSLEIPRMWGDESCQIYYLTKEAYYNGRRSSSIRGGRRLSNAEQI